MNDLLTIFSIRSGEISWQNKSFFLFVVVYTPAENSPKCQIEKKILHV